MPEFGEIYVCRFPFTSGTFSKPRPVLVLFDLGVDVLICRITSGAMMQYYAIGAHFAAEGLSDLSGHFYEQAEEEKKHALRIIQFVFDSARRCGTIVGGLERLDDLKVKA